MVNSIPLLNEIHKQWREAAIAWREVRRRLKADDIRDLQVSLRRLSTSLLILYSIQEFDDVRRIRGQVRKLQKRLGLLRNLQAQVSGVRKWRERSSIRRLRNSLRRQKKREEGRILRILTTKRRRKLSAMLSDIEKRSALLLANTPSALVLGRVNEAVRARYDDFRQKVTNLAPFDSSSLDDLRRSARKLRYALEAAAPVLGSAPEDQLALLHNYQTELGRIRDIHLLEDRLNNWGRKRRSGGPIARRCRRLARKRVLQTKKFMEIRDEDRKRLRIHDLWMEPQLSLPLWEAFAEESDDGFRGPVFERSDTIATL
jgi:CHAD domain-containing protein